MNQEKSCSLAHEDEEEAEEDEQNSRNSGGRNGTEGIKSFHSSFSSAFYDYCNDMEKELSTAKAEISKLSEIKIKLEEELKQKRNMLQEWSTTLGAMKEEFDKQVYGGKAAQISLKRKYVAKVSERKKCSICNEAWTPSGNHIICSLSCGHFFGRSCITQLIKKDGTLSAK
ncbi:hypothetical protein SUGI_0541240, partial [Cryptomeria japonica]